MSVLSKDADVVVRWSTAERVAALKRFVVLNFSVQRASL